MRLALPTLAASLLLGCAGSPELRVAHVEQRADVGVRAALALADAHGEPLFLHPTHTSVLVETRAPDGAWSEATEVVLALEGAPLLEVVVVADNSGSLDGYEEVMREAVSHFAHVLLASAHPDRMGLVRVSTEPAVLQALTDEVSDMHEAADTLFIHNGWTALWRGVALANEVLQEGAVAVGEDGTCLSGAFATVVGFTDGRDNNSAGQRVALPEGAEPVHEADLYDLKVFDAATAVHFVGVGGEVDREALERVADHTGGTYTHLDTYMMLVGALEGTAGKLTSQVPVCFRPADCAHTEARIEVTSGAGSTATTASTVVTIPSTCD